MFSVSTRKWLSEIAAVALSRLGLGDGLWVNPGKAPDGRVVGGAGGAWRGQEIRIKVPSWNFERPGNRIYPIPLVCFTGLFETQVFSTGHLFMPL